ncbi:MAG: hypothetical protein ACTSUE_16890 [Promethearchaeota archaeon]
MSGIIRFENLERLTIKDQPLLNIPHLNGLNKLKIIEIRRCPIDSLEWLGDLPALERLVLVINEIIEIPDLKHLSLLKELIISHNPISEIVMDIFPPSIEILELSYLRVTRLAALTILPLKNLKTFKFFQLPPHPPNEAIRSIATTLAEISPLERVELIWDSILHPYHEILEHWSDLWKKEKEHNIDLYSPLINAGFKFTKKFNESGYVFYLVDLLYKFTREDKARFYQCLLTKLPHHITSAKTPPSHLIS